MRIAEGVVLAEPDGDGYDKCIHRWQEYCFAKTF
ncbi:hypothetical protein BDE36_1936 [Arcticibacter tournemirensis]|nr:hypothetical protein BDE36_1936 [Arcticibacter tournemirensis]